MRFIIVVYIMVIYTILGLADMAISRLKGIETLSKTLEQRLEEL